MVSALVFGSSGSGSSPSPGHGALLSQYLSPPVEMVAGDLAAGGDIAMDWRTIRGGGGGRDVSIRVMQQRPG